MAETAGPFMVVNWMPLSTSAEVAGLLVVAEVAPVSTIAEVAAPSISVT